jgi:tetratricopeptide (TPR) repeat protein
LSSDNLLRKSDLFDPCDKQIIRIRKKMLQFRVIYRKKNRAEFIVLVHLLNEIIKEARTYEQYDILVEALIFKKYLLMLRKEYSEIKEIDKKIKSYTEAHKMMLVANDHYFNLIVEQEIVNNFEPAEKLKMLKGAASELQEFVNQTESSNISFIQKILDIEVLILSEQYQNTVNLYYEMIAYLFKHPEIYRDSWVGFAYDNISQCQVYNQDYQIAVMSSQKAQTFYPAKSNSLVSSKQQEFYALFYSKKFNLANAVIKILLDFPMINSGDFRYHKFLFLNACTLFKMGFYTEAYAICNQNLEISKDKIRWDIGLRYLRYMCQVEHGDFDGAQKTIDAHRKSINRNKKTVSSRDELIHKLLTEYSRSGFIRGASAKLQGYWEKLNKSGDLNSWKHYTHELIPVHSWIAERVKFKV